MEDTGSMFSNCNSKSVMHFFHEKTSYVLITLAFSNSYAVDKIHRSSLIFNAQAEPPSRWCCLPIGNEDNLSRFNVSKTTQGVIVSTLTWKYSITVHLDSSSSNVTCEVSKNLCF